MIPVLSRPCNGHYQQGPWQLQQAPPNLKSDANQDHLGYVSAQPLLSIVVPSDCKPATWLSSL